MEVSQRRGSTVFKMVPSAILSPLASRNFSLKSYDVCAVKPSYDYDVKRLLDILRLLSMSDES